jgi:pyruvate formate lyase activating enzyme
LHIVGIQRMSLIDFPGNIAVVLFTGGCDFRCPNCQNPDLVQVTADTPHVDVATLWASLEERKNWADGVVITGGEPLLQPHLPEFCVEFHQRANMPIKIDTNGHHPEALQRLIDEGNIAYVAMDVKAAPARYSEATGKLVNLDRILRSIELLKQNRVTYEFRTTVVPGLVDEAAIEQIGKLIEGAPLWALQQFQNKVVLDPAMHTRKPLAPERIRALAVRAAPFAKKVVTRGI